MHSHSVGQRRQNKHPRMPDKIPISAKLATVYRLTGTLTFVLPVSYFRYLTPVLFALTALPPPGRVSVKRKWL